MWNEKEARSLFMRFLPNQARILAIQMADLDGDTAPEIVGAYRWKDVNYLLLLKLCPQGWVPAAHLKGVGYQVSYFHVAHVTNERKPSVVVGWQVGAQWSMLAIYDWTWEGFNKQLTDQVSFSRLEVEDMDQDGKADLALWVHDTGEAYEVEIYHWDHGKLYLSEDAYPSYFKKVSSYYKRLTAQFPAYPFYWYYLADAELKAGWPEQAFLSLEKGLLLQPSYPSEERWAQLKKNILALSENRNPSLHPASYKSVMGMKWGYIDNQGRFVIPPRYDFADSFQDNGLAVVGWKDGNALINRAGQVVTREKWDYIGEFSEGRAIAIDEQGFKVINESGKINTQKPYGFIGSYQEGRAEFSSSTQGQTKYGYLDLQGQEIIPAEYDSADPFKDGYAVVQVREGEFALIDRDGRRIQTYPYAYVGQLGDQLLAFKSTTDGKFGYIDLKGKVTIPARFSSAEAFQEERAVVNTSDNYMTNQYGLIDRKGNFLIPPKYNDIVRLGDKRVAVGKANVEGKPYYGSKYAIADLNGKILTDFVYYDVLPYERGLSSVSNGQITFFINRNGKRVKHLPNVQGAGTLSIEGNLIKANVNQRTSYYDASGSLVWEPNTLIPLNPPYQIREKYYNPNKDYYVYYPQIEGMNNQIVQKQVNQRLKELSQVKNVPSHVQLEASYAGDFTVKFYQKDLLVLELTSYEYPFGAAHGMPSQVEVHINLANGNVYQLKDLFKPGSDYVRVLSDIIGKQIETNPEYSYVFADSYKGIEANQPFYVTADALYVYFNPYEISPYAAGFPTFKIPFHQLNEIIDFDGEFWRSFHFSY